MKLFDEITGQKRACGILENELNNNKTTHAYLFCGPEKNIMLDTALCFSYGLLYDYNLNEPENYERIKSGSHPDVQIFAPEGARGYLTQQVRDIIHDATRTPVNAKRKVYILQDAEKLNTSSANAFLKTLEEPFDYVTIILLTDNIDNVLPTIVSRCQVLNFRSLPLDSAVKYVALESGASLQDAKEALELFGGDTKKAIEYNLDQNLIDLHSEVEWTVKNLRQLSDWEVLEKSKDVVTKINEICNVYKENLDENTKELSEVLEGSAVKQLEKQNKRALSNKQVEMLHLFCACIKSCLQKSLQSNLQKNQNLKIDYCIDALNVVGKYEQYLQYNISSQNFCDVVLLTTKNKLETAQTGEKTKETR